MKKKKTTKKKSYKDDDGRVIANMDFDNISRYKKGQGIKREVQDDTPEPPLTRKETNRLITSALFASLLIGVIFMGILGLFIFILVNLWT